MSGSPSVKPALVRNLFASNGFTPPWNLALRMAAWTVLLAIAAATLGPMETRPELASAGFERAGAFALLGTTFMLAYPRRMLLVAAVVGLAAIGFEAAQLLVPGRHAHLWDMGVKLAGGGLGILAVAVLDRTLRRIRLG